MAEFQQRIRASLSRVASAAAPQVGLALINHESPALCRFDVHQRASACMKVFAPRWRNETVVWLAIQTEPAMKLEAAELTPLAYSPDDACRVLAISKSNLYSLIRAGKIPTRKIGRRTLIPAAGLRALLQIEGEAA